jgi:hypothetical protein
MLFSNPREVETAALAFDLPATYTGDHQTLDLRPRFRYAATHGDSGLLSDFQYLDSAWKTSTETDTLQLSGTWHRDSTYYNPTENTGLLSSSVRRMEQTAGLDWQRQLSERNQFGVTLNWDHVGYAQGSATGLGNFQYPQGSLQFSRRLTERLQWSLGAGFGRYEISDHSYRTDNPSVHMGLEGQLTEQWTLSASAGASRLQERSEYGPFVFTSSRDASTYALALSRQGARRAFSLSYTRALQPSGYGVLLTQDVLSLTEHYTWSERWSGSAMLRGTRQVDSFSRINFGDRRFAGAELAATWRWTAQSLLSLEATYNEQRLDAILPHARGTALHLTYSRQFGRMALH